MVAVPAFAGGGGGFLLSNRMERAAVVQAPATYGAAAAGGSGRDLDAYRSMPIPVAGRGPALAALPTGGRGSAAPAAFGWLR